MLNRRTLLSTAAATGAVAAFGTAAQASDPAVATQLNTVFDDIYKERLKHSPESLTSLGLDKGDYADAKGKLSDYSAEEQVRSAERLTRHYNAVKAIPREGLTGMDRINYDSVLWSLATAKQGADNYRFGSWGSYPYVLSQLSGVYQSTPDFLASQHTIATKDDADAYLSRLDAFATAINQQTERFRMDAAKGIVAPDFALDKALTQMAALRAVKGADSAMTRALVDKTAKAGIAGDWSAEAARRIDGPVAAALDAQMAALTEARKTAVHDAGVWRLKDGEAYYAYGAKVGTTTNLTPAEIHQIGLDLVKEISAEADVKLKAIGYTKGTVGERMRALSEDPQYVYANTDEAKEKLLGDLNVQIRAIEARLPDWFGVLPKTAVTVKRVPKETEAGSPGGYYQRPTLDGSRPGAYYINLRDTAEWPSWSLPTLTYHEAIPGHHMQISIQMEAQGLPMLRKTGGFSAYSEGWGLYAELLAAEMGMYDADVPGYIGYLQSSLFRAIRLVVDTGMHAKRWTREEAIAYFVATNGDQESAATTEIERYCVWPGQALSYMIGKIQWMRLRDLSRAKLGDAFDIRKFHDTGLTCAAVPLAVLEQVYKDAGMI